jgi:hypothetical protein
MVIVAPINFSLLHYDCNLFTVMVIFILCLFCAVPVIESSAVDAANYNKELNLLLLIFYCG